MKRFRVLVLAATVILLLGLVQAASAASPIYVRPGGDDTNCDGTADVDYPGGTGPLACAVKTIQKGVDLVDAGGTVNVAAGTYAGNVTIGKSLTLLGDPGDATPGPGPNAPVIDGGSTPGSAFFLANGVSHVTIKGFEMRNYTSNDNGVGNGISAWVGSTSDITVQDNYFHHLGWNGILVGNDYDSNPAKWGDHTNWLIKANVVDHVDYIGFELTNTSSSSIEGNVIHLNNPTIGAIFSSARRNESGLTIKNNTIDGTPSANYPVVYIYADDFETPNVKLDGVLIQGNTISTVGTPKQVQLHEWDNGKVINVAVHTNKLTSFKNTTSAQVDAENNYWGTTVFSEIVPRISGNVDWSPWCNADFTACNYHWPVHNVTQDTYHQTIQAGVDAAVAGDTINVAAGLYVEDIKLAKALTLLGPKHATPRNTGSATDWTSATTANWTAADATAAGEAVIRSATVALNGVIDIVDDVDVTIKGFVVEARNRTDSTDAQLIYTAAKNGTIETVVIENNIIGPITGATQDGTKGRFGIVFDSQIGGPNGLAGSVKGNKVFGAEGNGSNVFAIGSHYNPSMSDYSGMVIENNDVYGSNRTGLELVGGLVGLEVRNNSVMYNGYIWNGTAYVQSTKAAANPSSITYGDGIHLNRSSTICGTYPPATQNPIKDALVSGNTIAHNEKHGIYVDAQQRNLTITANVISSNGRNGIWLDEFGTLSEPKQYNEAYGYLQNATISNNIISGAAAPYAAIWVTGKPPDLLITGNDLSGNAKAVVQEDGIGETWAYTANASGNWWGVVTPAGVAALVSADVDYTPWLASGTDTQPATPGFQGDFSTLWVDDDSPQTGATGRIQEAINLVSGSTVHVAAGTYDEENILITKGITLQGAGAATTFIAPSAVTNNSTIVVQNPSGDVLIDGFTFTMQPKPNYGSAVAVTGKNIAVDSATVTISNNVVNGSNDGSKSDYGFYGQGNHAKLVITKNTINKTGNNPIVMENQVGSTTVSNNIIYITDNVDYNPYFSMTYGGTIVTTPQIVEGNRIYLDHAGTGYSEAITFVAAANGNWQNSPTDVGGYRDVKIRDNTIYGGGERARGIGIFDNSHADGQGTISGLEISGNSFIGENPTDPTTIGIYMYGDVEDAVIQGNNIDSVLVGVQLLGGLKNAVYPSNTVMQGNMLANNTTAIVVNGGTLQLTGNSIINNDTGIKVQNAGTVSPLSGNSIAGNTTLGVNNTTATAVNADGNWWGHPTGCGPVGGTGYGDHVSTLVTCASPLAHSPTGVAAIGFDPNTCAVARSGPSAVLTIKMLDVVNLYGYQFKVNYDATRVGAVGAFVNSWFNTVGGSIPWGGTCSAGVCQFSVSLLNPTPAVNGSGPVATVTLTGLPAAPFGTFTVDFSDVILTDKDANAQPTALSTATCAVYDVATINGTVTMQGRATPKSAGTVRLFDESGFLPAVVAPFSAVDGSFTAQVPWLPSATTYSITASHWLYLTNLHTGLTVNGAGPFTLPTTRLLAGDANNSGKIFIDDLSCIGGRFGLAPGGACGGLPNSPDINEDGIVNVLDLVLAGGNYGLEAPQTW